MHHRTPASQASGRARTAFALLLLGFLGVSGWLVFGQHLGGLARLGIPTMQPRFVDARVITGATVTLAQGKDPLVSNPGDPLGRPLNYPRVWLLLADLGLGPDDATKLALLFFAAFFAGLVLLLPLVQTPAGACWLAAGMFSPAAWLGVERGNTDLLMFGMLAATAWLAARHARLASLCVGAAAALKLYPIFALAGTGAAGARKALPTALGVLALFVGYAWWIRADLQLIHANTAHWNRIAYGIDQLPELLAKHTGFPFALLLAAGAMALLLAFAASVVVRRHQRLGAAGSLHALAAFRCGAAVYFGTFCSGSNFDYRLMCLLLTVPMLTAWAAAVRGPVRAGAWTLLFALVLMLWSMTWQHWLLAASGSEVPGLSIDELLNWTLAVGLLAGLVLTLPDGMVPAAWRGAPFLDATGEPAIAAAPTPAREGSPAEALGTGSDRCSR